MALLAATRPTALALVGKDTLTMRLPPSMQLTYLRQNPKGFTLIELLLVLAIAALLLTFAVPSFTHLIQEQRLRTSVNDLFYAIERTRAEAIKRNRIVQLAPNDGHNWAQGWHIYMNSNNQAYRDGDTILLTRTALGNGIRIDRHASDTKQNYIAYNGSGRSITRNGATQAGSWRLSLPSNTSTRIIIINFQSRTRVCNPAHDSCPFK